MPRTRLYCPAPLAHGASAALDTAQAHKLRTVLRLAPGDGVRLFNARDGEWRARLTALDKKRATATVDDRLRAAVAGDGGEGPWLAFAPLKKDAMDVLVEKAVELGAGRLIPVRTAHTDVSRVNIERLTAQARAAAEQCERLDVPMIADPMGLNGMLDTWPADRALIVCAEAGPTEPLATVARRLAGRPVGFLIGPEGGYASSELDGLGKLGFVHLAGLGPRVLRAETAVLAALATWQAVAGDADGRPPLRD